MAFRSGAGVEMQAMVWEYEPRADRPDLPHLYLATPVHPADDLAARVWYGQLVRAIVTEFRLCWHLSDRADHEEGCVLVVTPASPTQPDWWTMWPWTSPAVSIPMAWIRRPAAYDMRLSSSRHEYDAVAVAEALGHPIPYWLHGSNDMATVAAWLPGGPSEATAVPAEYHDWWLIHQFAQAVEQDHPRHGFLNLAHEAGHALRDGIESAMAKTGEPPEITWRAGATFVQLPVVEQSPDPIGAEPDSLDVTESLLASPSTPRAIASALYRTLGDPARGRPVVISREQLGGATEAFQDTIDNAELIVPATPRHRHLVKTATHESQVAAWQLYQYQADRLDHHFATAIGYVAWVPGADRLVPERGFELLPCRPAEVLLVRDKHGALGGLVIDDDNHATPLPINVIFHGETVTLASVLTGVRKKDIRQHSRLSRVLRSIPSGRSLRLAWPNLLTLAADLESVSINSDRRQGSWDMRPFMLSRASMPAIHQPLTEPMPAQLRFSELKDPMVFERMVLDLAMLRPDVRSGARYGVSGQRQGGIDVYCDLNVDSRERRRYLTIECKNWKNLNPNQLDSIVEKMMRGNWFDRTKTFVVATSMSTERVEWTEEVLKQRDNLGAYGIGFDVWGSETISRLCQTEHAVVSRAFGVPIADQFCVPRNRT